MKFSKIALCGLTILFSNFASAEMLTCVDTNQTVSLKMSATTCKVEYSELEGISDDWGTPQADYSIVNEWNTDCERQTAGDGYGYTFSTDKTSPSFSAEVYCESKTQCNGTMNMLDKAKKKRINGRKITCTVRGQQ